MNLYVLESEEGADDLTLETTSNCSGRPLDCVLV